MTQAHGNAQLTNGNGTNFWDQFVTTVVPVASMSRVCIHITVNIHIEILNTNMINSSVILIWNKLACFSHQVAKDNVIGCNFWCGSEANSVAQTITPEYNMFSLKDQLTDHHDSSMMQVPFIPCIQMHMMQNWTEIYVTDGFNMIRSSTAALAS